MNVPTLLTIAPTLDASKYQQGAAQMERANENIADSSERVDRAQSQMATSITTSASSVDKLQASLDKGFAAQQQYNRFLDRINEAHERGRITDQRRIELLDLAQQRYQRATGATTALATATAGAALSSGALTQRLQQAGYQIGDFASQVSAGGSAVTAFVQQGSQMLGMFGTAGALGGAVLAIGGIAYQMYQARNATQETRDAMSQLADEIKRVNEETARTTAPTPRLAAQLERANLEAEIARLRTATGQGGAVETGGMMGELGVGGEASAVQASRNAERIRELTQRLDELTQAEQRNRIAAMLSNDAYNYSINISENLVAQTRERERAAEEAARATAQYDEQLSRTLMELRTQQERYNQQLEQQARALRAQIDPQEAYRQRLDELNVLLRAGKISNEEYGVAAAQAFQRINGAAQSGKELGRELGFTFSSAFEDAIIRGEKLRSVLSGIAQDIARIMLRRSITEPLANVFGDFTASIGRAIGGSLFGGGAGVDIRGPGGSTTTSFGGPRASGGPVSAGTAYLIGEEGPELFVPRQSGAVVPNHAIGGGGMVVNQTIQISVGVAQTVRAEIAALLPQIKRQTIDAVADARMRGGSFAAAMGT